jgi:hypothetical protein
LLNLAKKDEAIEYYKLGIEEFFLGLSVNLGKDELERGLRIQEKMETNLKMALERVRDLSKRICISKN